MRVAALAALLVLGLGLPRLLVLCQHANGTASLELQHAAGSCCHHGPDDHADAASHGAVDATGAGHAQPGVAPDESCDHRQLAVELLPAPRPDVGEAPSPLAVSGWLVTWMPPTEASRAMPRHPPATGPPRIDRRTALRATTLLLV